MTARPYAGRLTCCHSQALLTAYAPHDTASREALIAFELASTVPFGIVSNPTDPNRILNCFIDPDLAIDRALESLGVEYRVQSWDADGAFPAAIDILRTWLRRGPTVVGPVDLGWLSYVGHGHIYATCDHYLVVLGVEGDVLSLCDPEGYPLLLVRVSDLLRAWRAADVPEGRGAFVMRQVLAPLSPRLTPSLIRMIVAHAAANVRAARQHEFGGGNALRLLARGWDALQRQPSLRRGTLFAVSIRMQRLLLQRRLAEELIANDPLLSSIDTAMALLGRVLSDSSHAPQMLLRAGDVEDELTGLLEARA